MRMNIGGLLLAALIVFSGLPLGTARASMEDLTAAIDNLGRTLFLHLEELAKAR